MWPHIDLTERFSVMDGPCSKDYQLAREIMDWEKDAYHGAPTSAHAPAFATPCRLVDRFPALDTTPPPIPNPLKKSQLAAAKRLEKDMKMADAANKKRDEKKAKKQKKQDKKDKKAANNGKKNQGKEKKNRKPNEGPLTGAMKEYIQRRRAGGLSYREAMKEWGESSERAEIVNKMSYSEQKRRRYN